MTNGLNRIPLSRDQGLTGRNHAELTNGDVLVKMIREDLIAKRITIDGCRGIIHYLRDHDAPTCRRLADILALNGQRVTDVTNRPGLVFRKPPQASSYE